jgi:hypothetical protein
MDGIIIYVYLLQRTGLACLLDSSGSLLCELRLPSATTSPTPVLSGQSERRSGGHVSRGSSGSWLVRPDSFHDNNVKDANISNSALSLCSFVFFLSYFLSHFSPCFIYFSLFISPSLF